MDTECNLHPLFLSLSVSFLRSRTLTHCFSIHLTLTHSLSFTRELTLVSCKQSKTNPLSFASSHSLNNSLVLANTYIKHVPSLAYNHRNSTCKHTHSHASSTPMPPTHSQTLIQRSSGRIQRTPFPLSLSLAVYRGVRLVVQGHLQW